MQISSLPIRFRRTLLFTAVLQATLPALTACGDAVARTSSPVSASGTAVPSGHARSPFSADREQERSVTGPDNLPSLGTDTDPAGAPPDELKTAQAHRQAQVQETDTGAAAVASVASTAGGMLQNGHAGDAAVSMARGMATGRASQTLQDWFSTLGNARLRLNVDENFSLKNSEFDLLHPWWETPDNMLFSQTSVHRTDDRSQGNLGVGWRHWNTGTATYGLLHGNYMTGLNTFLDYDFSRDHARLGVGAEFWRDYFKFGANAYHRLTNWKTSPDLEDYEERPADGWDIRTEGWLPSYPQFGAKLSYEQYYGHDVGLFGYDNLQKDPHAFTAGLSWTPFPLMSVTAEQRQGKQGENDSRIGVEFTWRPDQTWQSQTDPAAVGALRTLAGNRHDFIERNNNIVLEYRKKEVIAIALPDRVEGKSGMSYPLSVTLSKAKYGLDTIQWDDAALLAAGGALTCTTLTDCTLKMPAMQSTGNNTYTVGAVATDRKGNTSARVQTTVVVTGVGISTGQSSILPADDTLPADGQTQTTITAVLKSEDGQPVTGLAGDLALNGSLTPDSGIVDVKTVRGRAAGQDTTLTPVKETQPGIYTSTLTAGTTAGKYALSLAYAGSPLLTSQVTLADTLADLSASTLSADKTAVVASDGTDPGNTVTLTAVLKDRNGQPVTKGTGKVSFFLEGDDDDLAATPDSSHPGTWTATWSSARAQDVKSGLKINGKDTGKRVALTVTPEMTSLAPALYVVTGNVPADGKTPAELRIATADRFGNRVAKQTVTLGAQDTAVSLKDATVTSDDQGETSTTLTSTTSGEKAITAELNGQTVTAKVWFLADAASAKVDTLVPDVTEKPVGAGPDHAITLTATVTDGLGNPVPGTEVTWSQDAGTGYNLSTEKNITDSQGHATVTLTAPSGKAHDGISVSAATASSAPKTAKVSFTADVNSAQVKTVVLNDPSVTEQVADGVATFAYTAHVEDQYGNPVKGGTVNWTSNVGAVTLVAAQTLTDAGGNTGTTTHSTVSASGVIITASTPTGAGVDAPAVSFVPDVNSARMTITPEADGVVADGVTPLTLHVLLADAAGVPIPGTTVTADLSASPEVTVPGGKTDFVTDSDGKTDIELVTTKAGQHEVTLSATPAGGKEVKDVGAFRFMAGPYSKANSEVLVLKDAAAEGTPLEVLFYPRDQYNNSIALAAIKDHVTLTGTDPNGVTVTWRDSTGAAGEPVIAGTVTPVKYEDTIRYNKVTLSVDGDALAAGLPLRWSPDLYHCPAEVPNNNVLDIRCTSTYQGYDTGLRYNNGEQVATAAMPGGSRTLPIASLGVVADAVTGADVAVRRAPIEMRFPANESDYDFRTKKLVAFRDYGNNDNNGANRAVSFGLYDELMKMRGDVSNPYAVWLAKDAFLLSHDSAVIKTCFTAAAWPWKGMPDELDWGDDYTYCNDAGVDPRGQHESQRHAMIHIYGGRGGPVSGEDGLTAGTIGAWAYGENKNAKKGKGNGTYYAYSDRPVFGKTLNWKSNEQGVCGKSMCHLFTDPSIYTSGGSATTNLGEWSESPFYFDWGVNDGYRLQATVWLD